jgi:hypothetical protein
MCCYLRRRKPSLPIAIQPEAKPPVQEISKEIRIVLYNYRIKWVVEEYLYIISQITKDNIFLLERDNIERFNSMMTLTRRLYTLKPKTREDRLWYKKFKKADAYINSIMFDHTKNYVLTPEIAEPPPPVFKYITKIERFDENGYLFSTSYILP